MFVRFLDCCVNWCLNGYIHFRTRFQFYRFPVGILQDVVDPDFTVKVICTLYNNLGLFRNSWIWAFDDFFHGARQGHGRRFRRFFVQGKTPLCCATVTDSTAGCILPAAKTANSSDHYTCDGPALLDFMESQEYPPPVFRRPTS